MEEQNPQEQDHHASIIEAIQKLDDDPLKNKRIRFVGGSGLSRADATLLWNVLPKHKSLLTLEIVLCEIQKESILDLCKIIPTSHFKLLQLIKVGLTDETFVQLVKSLIELYQGERNNNVPLSDRSFMIRLNVSLNNIGKDSADAIGELIYRTPIQVLELGRNNISDEGCTRLAYYLPRAYMFSLHILDISFNSITDIGLKKLCLALPNCRLRKLLLNGNSFTYEGIHKLCEVLPLTVIEHLGLCSNNLGDDHIVELMRILRKTKIVNLQLSSNCFTDIGGLAIANEIKHNLFIQEISMKETIRRLTNITFDAIRKAVCAHRSIKSVTFLTVADARQMGMEIYLARLHSPLSKSFVAICSCKLPGRSKKSWFKKMGPHLFRVILDMLK